MMALQDHFFRIKKYNFSTLGFTGFRFSFFVAGNNRKQNKMEKYDKYKKNAIL